MAQPHRPATPSSPANSDATEGLPASVTATQRQPDVPPSPAGIPGPAPEEPADSTADSTAERPVASGRRVWGRREALALGLAALLGTGIGVTAQRLTASTPPTPQPSALAKPTPAPTAPVQAKIAPVSPKDSSFTIKDGAYTSETYSNATFGNLKKGIGLLFDLGTARPLTSITFTADPGPLTVELRAGDSAASDGSTMTLVGQPVQANGPASLPATTGGSHRYWMIWVTQLPPGFKAKIANPVARG